MKSVCLYVRVCVCEGEYQHAGLYLSVFALEAPVLFDLHEHASGFPPVCLLSNAL